ncbi:MAG: aconitate hydratase AcnA [Proteobacteria bacterium]|nr:aconitate hydratase AcnA [Pseudomonadota bacterium]
MSSKATVQEQNVDSFGTRRTITSGTRTLTYWSLPALQSSGFDSVSRLPYSMRVLLENMLRTEDGRVVRKADIEAIARWSAAARQETEINYTPARVLMQDFTGVPAVVDLAVMRDAVARMGGDPARINPLQPADLVIDHSVQADFFGSKTAFEDNARLEFERNQERYEFLRWGQTAFDSFRVVPPDTGIVHQVNLEFLASVGFVNEATGTVYPDTVVGTDSHTTMINGLGVVGWGVGGIEAEAVMLGQPITMVIPQVVGFKLTGRLKPGATATDLVLTVTQMLRKKGVVGKFVEFHGDGISGLSVADRATIANMAPEYGATIGFFPVDDETLAFLRFTGRREEHVKLVEDYYKAQGLFHTADSPEPVFSDTLELDLSTVEVSLAGPKRPQDRVTLGNARQSFREALSGLVDLPGKSGADSDAIARWAAGGASTAPMAEALGPNAPVTVDGRTAEIGHGAVVITAITSCTNTSNPSVMIAAGLLAKKAVARGLTSKPWVKPTLSPGSKVVTEYLEAAGLLEPLEALRFHLAGYGCMTCIGNSGPLPEAVAKAVDDHKLVVCSVLSGNRNFEGRVNPHVKANYLASPPLVVAYALAGTMELNLETDPLGIGADGKPVMLSEIWPTNEEITEALRSLQPGMFSKTYADVFAGEALWQKIRTPEGNRFSWDADSTYVRPAPFFDDMPPEPAPLSDVLGARCLAVLGDSVTTDHISPAGNIAKNSPAAKYLTDHGVSPKDFNSYGARRGNHEVMMRGTFANIRLRNLMAPGTEGPITLHQPDGEQMFIYDASVKYAAENVPLVVLAGSEYGTGSSRDWAAKGPRLLGVKVVIAKSFERIHRSNLIGMGILPLQFEEGKDASTLGLTGAERFDIGGIAEGLTPGKKITVKATSADGSTKAFTTVARVDTLNEVDYYRHGGILHYVLRNLVRNT